MASHPHWAGFGKCAHRRRTACQGAKNKELKKCFGTDDKKAIMDEALSYYCPHAASL